MTRSVIFFFTVLQCAAGCFAQIEKADRLYDNFEFAAAADLYAKAKLKGQLDDVHRAKLAWCYVATNKHGKAETALRPLIGQEDPHMYMLYVETLKALGKTDEARKEYAALCTKFEQGPDNGWLASLDSIDLWRDQYSDFEVYPLSVLNSGAAELCPQLHKDGLLFLRERVDLQPQEGPLLAYAKGSDIGLQYGVAPTPRTEVAYAEYETADSLAFKQVHSLFVPKDEHLGPFCLDPERDLIYFTRSSIPELGGPNSAPWIFFGKYDILPDKVAHVRPFGAKVQVPLFEVISEMEETDIRDEKRKLENAERPDHQLITQIDLYLRIIRMNDEGIIEVVDSLFEAGELSGSLINAVNRHIESRGANKNEGSKDEKTVFWQPKAGVFAMGTPTLSRDGRTMVFSSTTDGGFGGADLYIIQQKQGKWTMPENLGPNINTAGNEMMPFLRNSSTLYFSSDGWPGYGGLDLFTSVNPNDNWQQANNMLRPFKSPGDDHGIVFERFGEAGYFSSNRGQGEGDDDLYRFADRSIKRDLSDNNAEDLYNKFIAIGDALFEEYDLLDSRAAYEEASSIRPSEEYPIEMIRKIDAMLNNIVVNDEANVVFTNIYYDYNRYNITVDAAGELERLALFMLDNPGLRVRMSSYADARGSREFNLSLSQKRADSAKRYMMALGVEEDRIITRGEGATKFVTVCPVPADCTEADHARNRRTEFSLIQ